MFSHTHNIHSLQIDYIENDTKYAESYREGLIAAYQTIKAFIDSLSEEPVSEDLDREIGYYTTSKLLGKRNHSTGVYHLTQKECDNIVRHFAEWQRKKDLQRLLGEVEKFISEKVQDYFLVDEEEYIVDFDKEECINDFKNYMQNE